MSANVRPHWMERPSRVGQGLKAVILVVVVILVVYPLLSVVMTSFATQHDITEQGGVVLFPLHLTLKSYVAIFQGGVVTRALIVSIAVTVGGTAASMLVTVAMAYGLSRPGIIWGRGILLVALLTLLFTPGIIPSFLVVKQLGLLDNYASLIVPVLVSAFNMVVMRNFFMQIPAELLDSARMDGAGDLRILTRIVLPLSKGVLAVVALFYAVNYWNAFFTALLYLNNSAMWPLSLVLRTYVLQGQGMSTAGVASRASLPPIQGLQMAVVVVALGPIVLLYPFLQRYFVKGVLTGAVKG